MKSVKRIFKWMLKCILVVLSIPILYLLISLLVSSITIERTSKNQVAEKSIYLTTNGVHLDIIIPKSNMNTRLLSGLKQQQFDQYFSFGWGDENFYLHTPTWGDLTLNNAFTAAFLKSSTLMHVTRYRSKHESWIEIKVTETELEKLNAYLNNSFETTTDGAKIMLKGKGYSSTDDFYKAKGSYSCFKTCNSWVNTGFKKSGLTSCMWTPFDFGLMNKYD